MVANERNGSFVVVIVALHFVRIIIIIIHYQHLILALNVLFYIRLDMLIATISRTHTHTAESHA